VPDVQPGDSRSNNAEVSQHRQRSLVPTPSVAGHLRVLEVTEIKTVPYVPLSHPFVERLIGTLRRECLDRTSFWTTTDLEAKLLDFQHYYNEHRTHAGRKGALRCRVSTQIAHEQISVVIAGRSIVEAYTNLRLPHDFSNSPPTGTSLATGAPCLVMVISSPLQPFLAVWTNGSLPHKRRQCCCPPGCTTLPGVYEPLPESFQRIM
jgi:hypothetical protein